MVTALAKITDDIRSGMDNKLTTLTLLGFSDAFNIIDTDVLFGVLQSINVSPVVVNWFRSNM